MSGKVTITIDGQQVQAKTGDRLLWVALENGFYIPHLCALPEQNSPYAACRLCFVEVEGKTRPVTACTEQVFAGMVVKTRSQEIDRLVKSAFELIMSNHRIDCKNCTANGSCALQRIAKERKIPLKPKNLPPIQTELPVDESKDGILYDPNKCVLCGRCVMACRQEGAGVLGFARRGFHRTLTTFGDIPLSETNCIGCGACIRVCPVGARTENRA